MATIDMFSGLNPKEVWEHFRAFTKIARPSGKEEGMRVYIEAWARDRRLTSARDTAGNVIVRVPASARREGAATVILQGHLDMVCTRDSDAGTNDPALGEMTIFRGNEVGNGFTQDPAGAWIKADRTSLGADDGIGVASALAVAVDPVVHHGPLELLFTIDEETGLTGATNLDPSRLQGKILLNLDSEEDDSLTIGSAGGRNVELTWTRSRVDTPEGWAALSVTLSGLRGGHSGVDINRGRLNAIKGLVRVLDAAGVEVPFRLAAVHGGDRSNAIPREAGVDIVLPAALVDSFTAAAGRALSALKQQYRSIEDEVALSCTTPDRPKSALSSLDTSVLIGLLRALPSGVVSMSQALEGLVETSCSLGVVSSDGESVKVTCSLRSSDDSALNDLTGTIQSIAALGGAAVVASPSYPGWNPDPTSKIVATLRETYGHLFSPSNGGDVAKPRVQAVHAGLECGVIQSHIPGLDTVSFGPTIRGAHSTLERVNIRSVEKFYQLLAAALDALSAPLPHASI